MNSEPESDGRKVLTEDWDKIENTESAEVQIKKLFVEAHEANPQLALTHSYLSKETKRGNAHVRSVCLKLVKEGFLEEKRAGRRCHYRIPVKETKPKSQKKQHNTGDE
tara:strand:- start:932 stop:1255 length:324 start_codon:yes stop_codon:yes gene_type:complete